MDFGGARATSPTGVGGTAPPHDVPPGPGALLPAATPALLARWAVLSGDDATQHLTVKAARQACLRHSVVAPGKRCVPASAVRCRLVTPLG